MSEKSITIETKYEIPYPMSSDYNRLCDLIDQGRRVICIANFSLRQYLNETWGFDKGTTLCNPSKDNEGDYALTILGRSIVFGINKERFIVACEREDVKFMDIESEGK